MQLIVLKGKTHRAPVIRCDLHYEGTITVDAGLMERARIPPYGQVDGRNRPLYLSLRILEI